MKQSAKFQASERLRFAESLGILPLNEMGLTSDVIRVQPDFQKATKRTLADFEALRQFSATFTIKYRLELADRRVRQTNGTFENGGGRG